MDLRQVKADAEALLNELTSRVKITVKARATANEAMGQYSQSYVRNDADAVLSSCARLESESRRACDELRRLIRGLDMSIIGYQRLEQEFA